jgi:tRNA (guanine26-N2/guanine27-N2)-dimethyltransferase
MEQIIEEGSARINAFVEDKVSKRLEVFYNPVMKLNRDVSILLLNSLGKKGMQIADPLAGSGIRAIRFLLELKKGKVENISINDLSENAAKNISQNLKLNKRKMDKQKIILSNEDANLFLLKSTGFDYIDIDPFGSPCPFLDTAAKRISRGGILAVTATDTAALAGSSKTACLRKYWALALRNELMHEIGMRILIRRVQLIGAEHDKALIPIFSYTDEHYYRVFFYCEKGKQKVDRIMGSHKFLVYNRKTLERKVIDDVFSNGDNREKEWVYAGPMWTRQLWDKGLVKKMFMEQEKGNPKLNNLLRAINFEAGLEVVGFYTLPPLVNCLGLKESPRKEQVLERLRKKGFNAAETHFDGQGIRTDAPIKVVLESVRL